MLRGLFEIIFYVFLTCIVLCIFKQSFAQKQISHGSYKLLKNDKIVEYSNWPFNDANIKTTFPNWSHHLNLSEVKQFSTIWRFTFNEKTLVKRRKSEKEITNMNGEYHLSNAKTDSAYKWDSNYGKFEVVRSSSNIINLLTPHISC